MFMFPLVATPARPLIDSLRVVLQKIYDEFLMKWKEIQILIRPTGRTAYGRTMVCIDGTDKLHYVPGRAGSATYLLWS